MVVGRQDPAIVGGPARPYGRRLCRTSLSATNGLVCTALLALILVLVALLREYVYPDGITPTGSLLFRGNGTASWDRAPPVQQQQPVPTNERREGQVNGTRGHAKEEESDRTHHRHALAGLDCIPHGGPSRAASSEMVFWHDIPSDSTYISPLRKRSSKLKLGDEKVRSKVQYLTFEPDGGGWNNIRMALETVLVMAAAMGRTLVLPPANEVYLLDEDEDGKDHETKTDFTFNDFFHVDWVAAELEAFDVITMEEFLKTEGMAGHLKNASGTALEPPEKRVDWDGKRLDKLWDYLRATGYFPREWNPEDSVLAFPASPDGKDERALKALMADIISEKHRPRPEPDDFYQKPTPVDVPPAERLREILAERKKMSVYGAKAQAAPFIHLKMDFDDDARLLTHFYEFLFFQDWRQDLWAKRFVRDHFRYQDEIMCAAARVVEAVRKRAKTNGDNGRWYDSMHIRRGDFQYEETRLPAKALYQQTKGKLTKGATLYIATDEKKKKFFRPFKEHYNVLFLDDFLDQLEGINPNYFGMLDQLVASRGKIFYGTYYSTLSGYINRIRGYHSTKHKVDGYKEGTIQSYYFNPSDENVKNAMRNYEAITSPLWAREFAVSWRDIDKGIKNDTQAS